MVPRNAYYGITIGKKIPLKNEKFNLEIFIGGGSSQSNYKYYNKQEQRIFAISTFKRKFNKSGEELPYRKRSKFNVKEKRSFNKVAFVSMFVSLKLLIAKF